MGRKLKPINNLNKIISDNEVQLDINDFERNKYALVDLILNHIKKATCTDCKWHIGIVGYFEANKIEKIQKDCLLKIYVELELLGSAIKTLIEEHGLIEDTTYKPKELTLKGIVMIYCES